MLRLALLSCLITFLSSAEKSLLFSGTWNDHWAHEGTQTFKAVNGVLRTDGHAHTGNWLRTAEEYEDFRLSLEYKLDQWAEAAVFLRAPRTARPYHAGLTVIIAHDFHKKPSPWTTGALAGVLEPVKWPGESWGVWHKLEVELIGPKLTVLVDGTLVQQTQLDSNPATANRLRRGYIGFADQGYGWEVRNVAIEDLGRPTKLIELLSSPNLEGWEVRGDSGKWTLQSGTLTGSDGHSIIYAPQAFSDFELTAVVRTQGRTNSGIFLRGEPKGAWRGFEIQVYSPVDAVYPTGSIYGKVRASYDGDLEGRWFLLQVAVKGNRVDVWIDGRHVSAFGGLSGDELKQGRVGFQIHLEKTSVEFRDVRVRPL